MRCNLNQLTSSRLALLVALSASTVALAQTPITTIRVYPPPATISALSRPVFATSPPGDTTRFFVVDQRTSTSTQGRIQILDLTTNTLMATPFLLTSGQSTGNEEGLLGLAFHPDFFAAPGNVNRGAFFIYITQGGNNHVIRYTTTGQDPNANTADAASAQTVIDFNHPTNTNHNGGWIAFGPDRQLYIDTGDGGSGCDPPGNAQNINSYLGKMHRLNVDVDQNPGSATIWGYTASVGNPFIGVAGLDEIWLYGLRNPWRSSFDRLTGDIYIGDVGQDAWEEVDFVPAGASGINFGWDVREGKHCSTDSGCPSTCSTAGFTDPIWDYDQRLGVNRQAVTGGYVYRGAKIPDLQGTYFFGDYTSGEIWSFKYTGVPLTAGDVTLRSSELAPGPGLSIGLVVSFAEDQNGEEYIIDQNGNEIFKIVVNCTGAAISYNSHPATQTKCVGDTVNFSVTTTGTRGAVSYDWQRNGSSIGAPSLSTLTLNNVQLTDAGSYTVVIKDQCNLAGITSNPGVLTVNDDPAISDQPDSQTVCAGSNVSFTVAAGGGDLSYDWQLGGSSLGAPNSPTLNLSNVQAGDIGAYTVVITNNCGNATSDPANLNVVAFPPQGDISGDCILQSSDRTLFVNVLLGIDTDAGHVSRSDLNSSGAVNGDDVQLFVALPVP